MRRGRSCQAADAPGHAWLARGPLAASHVLGAIGDGARDRGAKGSSLRWQSPCGDPRGSTRAGSSHLVSFNLKKTRARARARDLRRATAQRARARCAHRSRARHASLRSRAHSDRAQRAALASAPAADDAIRVRVGGFFKTYAKTIRAGRAPPRVPRRACANDGITGPGVGPPGPRICTRIRARHVSARASSSRAAPQCPDVERALRTTARLLLGRPGCASAGHCRSCESAPQASASRRRRSICEWNGGGAEYGATVARPILARGTTTCATS